MTSIASLAYRIARRPDAERWRTDTELRVSWEDRAHMIADLIPVGSTVLDLGAGTRRLADFLPPGCTYLPHDIVSRGHAETIVFNLNDRPLPDLRSLRVDVVVVAGVLEYLRDVEGLLAWAAYQAPSCIVTYVCADARWFTLRGLAHIGHRLRRGWINALSERDLLRAAANGRLTVDRRLAWGKRNRHRVFLLRTH